MRQAEGADDQRRRAGRRRPGRDQRVGRAGAGQGDDGARPGPEQPAERLGRPGGEGQDDRGAAPDPRQMRAQIRPRPRDDERIPRIRPGGSTVAKLALKIPDDAQPGIYRGVISARPAPRAGSGPPTSAPPRAS